MQSTRRPVGFIVIVTLIPLLFAGGTFAGSDTPSYLIGPDDVLGIYVWKEPDLTQDTVVLPDGRITFPLIGEVAAQGSTVIQLRDLISEKLANYVTAPEVTVVVRESRSRRIYTIGRVNRPGPYPLAAAMTVLQALSMAGGFGEWADTKNVLIIRRQENEEKRLYFNYKEFIDGKHVEQNVLLKPNDTIIVP
jgi:polysaccharide export outer membrane protein